MAARLHPGFEAFEKMAAMASNSARMEQIT